MELHRESLRAQNVHQPSQTCAILVRMDAQSMWLRIALKNIRFSLRFAHFLTPFCPPSQNLKELKGH